MEVPTTSWDSLRKQARKLEAQLDEQMNAYRKLVSTNLSTKGDAAQSDVESWIERLIKQLQQVNSQMQAWVSSGGSDMVSHTLTRHQEILQDITQEFYRLRSSLRAKQEHASLLDDFKEFDRTRLDLEEGGESEQHTLLKENASISRNTGHMDGVISQAQATLGALVFQRSTFGGINSKLSNVSSRLPTVGAEFIGTYIVMFAGIATAIVNQKIHNSETLIGCAGATGLAVMIIILSTGHISGAHLNPAVTISFAALKHFPWKNVPLYIAAQVLASICASFTLKGVFHPFMSGGVTVPSVEYGQAFALEFIISFNLMFVVTAVATDTRAVGELAGIAVGATVMLNILIAGPATGASMNPVRTLGPAIAANNYKGIWLYLIAPILGALGGAGAYTAIKLPDEEFNSEVKASSAPGSFRR